MSKITAGVYSPTILYMYKVTIVLWVFFFWWCCNPMRAMASSFLRFLDHTQRRTTFGRTPLDEWSARRRDLYLTTHNTHNRQTSMPPVGFEPTISAGKRPQTYGLDRTATGTSNCFEVVSIKLLRPKPVKFNNSYFLQYISSKTYIA